MGYYGHMGGFGFGMGLFSMLVFWAIAVFAIMALVRCFSGRGGGCWSNLVEHKNRENSALSILKERYAKGEIGKEDFEKMKKDLQ